MHFDPLAPSSRSVSPRSVTASPIPAEASGGHSGFPASLSISRTFDVEPRHLELEMPVPSSPHQGGLVDLVFGCHTPDTHGDGALSATRSPPTGLSQTMNRMASMCNLAAGSSLRHMEVLEDGQRVSRSFSFMRRQSRFLTPIGCVLGAMPGAAEAVASQDSPSSHYVTPPNCSAMEFFGSPESHGHDFLGKGASGSVRVAFHCQLNRTVARKSVRPVNDDRALNAMNELAFAERAISVAETRPQANVWAHIVEVYEAYHDDDNHEAVILMECMEAGTVGQLPEFAPKMPTTSTDLCGSFAALASLPMLPAPARQPWASSEGPTDNDAGALMATVDSRSEFEPSPPRGSAARRRHGQPWLQRLPVDREAALACVLRDALLGLKTLHEDLRVLHRDIKPSNLLVAGDGTVKLADFGVAVVLEEGQLVARDQAGSALYMAPERLRGEPHGPASDVWSLGVTALQLALRGEHPVLDVATAPTAIDRFWGTAERLAATGTASERRAAAAAIVDEACSKAGDVAVADFRDFVAAMLRPFPDERATVEELLSHPWLARNAVPEAGSP